jgi:hypothetical protein
MRVLPRRQLFVMKLLRPAIRVSRLRAWRRFVATWTIEVDDLQVIRIERKSAQVYLGSGAG